MSGIVPILAIGLLAVSGAVVEADTTTPDLLPGVDLVTEEVEPGVYRVLSDGIRDLSRIPRYSGKPSKNTAFDSAIAAGPDGSVWVSMPEGSFRVGQARTRKGDRAELQTTVAVGADGTVYTARTHEGVHRLSGDKWDAVEAFAGEWVVGLDATSGGALWAQVLSGDTGTVQVSRLAEDGLTTFDLPKRFARIRLGTNAAQSFSVSDDGHIWQQSLLDPSNPHIALTHFDGESWEIVDPAATDASLRPGPIDLGPEGTLWAYFGSLEPPPAKQERPQGVLARLRDGERTTYDATDGVPPMWDMYQGFEGFLRAAPDGSVWLTPQPQKLQVGDRPTECDGVARFDGVGWSSYLHGYCVYAIDVAADGAAWLHAGLEPENEDLGADRTPIDTYVITPEAVQ